MPDPTTNGYLSLDAIRAASGLRTKEVDCPEWGGKVLLRGISRLAFLEMQELAAGGLQNAAQIERHLLLHGMAAPALSSLDDAETLQRHADAGLIDRLIKEIVILSGVTEEALADAARSFQASSGAHPGVPSGA